MLLKCAEFIIEKVTDFLLKIDHLWVFCCCYSMFLTVVVNPIELHGKGEIYLFGIL